MVANPELTNASSAGVPSAPREYLAFRLGSEEYGIDILKVQEIREFEPTTKLANVPSFSFELIFCVCRMNLPHCSGFLRLLKMVQDTVHSYDVNGAFYMSCMKVRYWDGAATYAASTFPNCRISTSLSQPSGWLVSFPVFPVREAFYPFILSCVSD